VITHLLESLTCMLWWWELLALIFRGSSNVALVTDGVMQQPYLRRICPDAFGTLRRL
jgi:hypothetical protein